MPESIDWPCARHGRRFLLILAAIAGVIFGGRTAVSCLDMLWFGSLGYEGGFWKTLNLRSGIFTAFAAATFLILYGSFLALRRAQLPGLPSGQTILVGGPPVRLPVEPFLRRIARPSLAIAAATGTGMMVKWPTLALFWYVSRATTAANVVI
jgi:uncharacterized membrane protein (UPF0182 family)